MDIALVLIVLGAAVIVVGLAWPLISKLGLVACPATS